MADRCVRYHDSVEEIGADEQDLIQKIIMPWGMAVNSPVRSTAIRSEHLTPKRTAFSKETSMSWMDWPNRCARDSSRRPARMP